MGLSRNGQNLLFNKNGRRTVESLLLSICLLVPIPSGANAAASVTISQIASGPTPFISFIDLNGFHGTSLKKISFRIEPKPGSTAEAIQATYGASYLKTRGYLNTASGELRLPIFGLYQTYNNQVLISYTKTSGKKTLSVPLQTETWDNSCNDSFTNRTDVVARDESVKLGYSFFMLKGWVCDAHPVVLDIDGEIRWVGTAGNGEQGSTFFGNSMYLGSGSQLYKMELDGTYEQVGDYSEQGYYTFHHNIDYGKRGLLLELNHNSDVQDVEADIIEVDKNGALLKEWDIGSILDEAMIAGGDDPSGFVDHNGGDWFHNNAATYWKQKNQLVVSSRENFVSGIGYDDKKMKWILGDPEKAWYQYASLRAFALTLPAGDHLPIGQHAVSITSKGNLMLFDNGLQSFNHALSGSSRGYSAPRQYTINERSKMAREVWNYEHDQEVWSPICSSIYQDGSSYLINYASEGSGIRLVGLDSRSKIGFEWILSGTQFFYGWNAFPIHLEKVSY